jgi:solute carrier family 25 phosphate transporter 23/24/25/41
LNFRDSYPKNSNIYNFICGGLTGFSASTLTFPLDVVRTRLAVTTLNSKINEHRLTISLITLWKKDGIKGLYKGYSIASFVLFN